MNLVNEFENEESEITPVTESESAGSSEIAELLSGYKTAPIKTQPDTIDSGNETPTLPDDKSDPTLYFQSGAKKGQLKPRARKGIVKNDTETMTLDSELLSGALFLTLIDLIVPSIIVFLNNKVSKKKIEVDQLSLTPKQKAELERVADAVVKKINFNGSPVTLLLVSLLGIYGVNFMALKSLQK